MSNALATVEPLREPEGQGVRRYTLLCLLATLGIALSLLARDLGVSVLFPALFALLLPLVRWRIGPGLLLGAIGWTILADHLATDPFALLGRILTIFLSALASVKPNLHFPFNPMSRFRQPLPALDLLLCDAVLMWIAAYCRLLSVTWTIFPLDKRRRALPRKKPTLKPDLGQRRSAELPDWDETGRLLMGAALAAVLAQLLWRWLSRRTVRVDLASITMRGGDLNIPDGWWRMLVLLWLFGVVLIVATGILAYLGQGRMTSAEAALYLQDQLWRQTRREQARLNRWLAWAEKRAAARKTARPPTREPLFSVKHLVILLLIGAIVYSVSGIWSVVGRW